jgi:translation initiation factor IF-2
VAARAADRAREFESAEAFRAAVTAAVPLAGRDRVRSWADGVLPPEAGTRGRRHRSLEAALSAVPEPAAPAAAPPKAAPPQMAARAVKAAVPEEVAEDAIVAALTPLPGVVAAVAKRPPAAPAAARPAAVEPAQTADDLIVGEATGPVTAYRKEATPEIAFPRPAPMPSVAWNVVGASAGMALVVGVALGYVLGR